jgi:thiol-disulfide isomerase/thioredoxin
VQPIDVGSEAPPIEGVDLAEPRVLFFFKVTCPVCRLAAPVAERLHAAYGERIVGLGQDPTGALEEFSRAHGVTFASIPDPPPYPTSEAYGLRVVPTIFLVDGGTVLDVVESWDREGYNRVSHGLSELIGADASTVSTPGDGLPSFRPG